MTMVVVVDDRLGEFEDEGNLIASLHRVMMLSCFHTALPNTSRIVTTMTKLFCSSTAHVTSSESAISLKSRHCLLSDIPLPSSGDIVELCDDIDILHASPISFTIVGAYNGRRISHEKMLESMTLELILDYFRKHSGELGISSVSVPYVDETEGSLKFVVTPLRSVPTRCLQPHVTLLGIDFELDWSSVQAKQSQASDNHGKHNPFLGCMLLPSQMLLREVLDRFLDAHILRRYPLIFGPDIQRLDSESTYFVPLSKAVLRVVERSANNTFRQECRTMLNSLKRRHLKSHWSSHRKISRICYSNMSQELLEVSDQNHGSDELEISFQDALCLSMDRIFRHHTSLAPFKDITPEPKAEPDSEDHGFDFSASRDLFFSSSENSQDISQPSSLFSDEEEPLDVLFHEHYPGAVFKTAVPSSDICQEEPNSRNVHATWDKYSGGKGINWELRNDFDNLAPLTSQANILLSDDDDNISEASSMNFVPDDNDPPLSRKNFISLVPELVDDSDDVPPMEVSFDPSDDLFDEDMNSEYDAAPSYDFAPSVGVRGLKESADTSLDSTRLFSATLRDANIDYELDLFYTDSAASSLSHKDIQERSPTTKADINTAVLVDNKDNLVTQHHCAMNENEWNISPADAATPYDTFSVLSDHDDDPCNEDDNDLLWRDEVRRDAGLV